jgi:hypothetical protein
MADNYLSSIAVADTERSLAIPASSTYSALGTPFPHNPVIIIFDNQGTVSAQISFDGVNPWKTFTAGEAFVLDMRANHGQGSTWTFPIGTQVYVNGTAGATGNFKVSILYAGN